MKKTLLAAGLSLASASLMAAGTSLETDAEKFSYAVGLNFAQSMMRQGAPLDADAVYMALKDALGGSEPRLSAEVMQTALKTAAQAAGSKKKEMAMKNMEAGKAYMAKNKSKKSVTTLPDGLQYEVLREGTGAQPTEDSTVKVHYTGKLIDGREFDSSRRDGQPVTFPVNGVIPGWQKILPLMKTGARWQVTIPPDLAYGVEGAGAAIGPNETLVFEIELLEVVK